jgi:hypothetical protein
MKTNRTPAHVLTTTVQYNTATWTVVVDVDHPTMATFTATLTVDQFAGSRAHLNAVKGPRGTIYVYTSQDDDTIPHGMLAVSMYAAVDALP